MPQPLTGLRVADFSHVMAGPYASHFLRMLGADVVKVEPPAGDNFRYYGPFREFDGLSPAFVAANVGKRSMVLNLKLPQGVAVAKRLIEKSDVVLENFRPGVMDRLGLGYAVAKQLRPDIVYCAVSGYGQDGPLRDLPAIDNIVQATSGMMAANGNEGDLPSRVGWPVVDTYTGTLAALAILAAIIQRQRFGSGQYIDVAMMDASLAMLTSLATPYLMTGQMVQRSGDTGYSGSPSAAMYATSDGTLLSLGVVQDKHFERLCAAIGQPDLVGDERFSTTAARSAPRNAPQLRERLSTAIKTRTGAEWEAELTRAGVPCGLVRDVSQACVQEGLIERGLFLPTEVRTTSGETRPGKFINAGFVFQHGGPGVAGNAPQLGEHTQTVLQELGYGAAEVEELMASGAVGRN